MYSLFIDKTNVNKINTFNENKSLEANAKPVYKTSSIFNAQNPVVAKGKELVREKINNGDNKMFQITQGRMEQWCADTVNYLYLKSTGKDPFGVDKKGNYINSDVNGLKNWGIKTKRYKNAQNLPQIKKQINSLKPGDVIIFKSPYTVKIVGGKDVTRHASHTGIVECVKNGSVKTIEGNANFYRVNNKGERFIVHNLKEGTNGNKSIGDFQVTKKYNGVYEENYTPQELQANGYSGYIDMQNIIK